ncbi:hypothetical protein ASD21_15730 [Caulobacter sp. Root1455]|nr:hypothetical protein ASD38_19150 [Caulobacter sp. Root487D2Y]KQY92813.1 hypothetical protein ASD21_15730 [Caulobacter sp. Root1455]
MIGVVVLAAAAVFAAQVVFTAAAERKAMSVAAARIVSVRHYAGPLAVERLGRLGRDFDATASGTLILRVEHGLVALRPDGGVDALPAKGPTADSFALDTQDNLLTVAGGYFGRLTEAGEAQPAVPLPYDDARLARSIHPGAVYLFGGGGGEQRLYRFWDTGNFEVLLASPTPILGVTDTAQAVYVAGADRVVRLDGRGAVTVFRIPPGAGLGPIVSVAATAGGQVLVSTANQVFAIGGGAAATVVNDSGGELRARGDRVYVLDRTRGLIYALDPAPWPAARKG